MKENSTYSFCETEFFSSSVLEADFENPVYIEPLVDNWTYNPKNEKVYFENSAIHFSPKMNGAAIVRKEPFSTTIFLFITYRVKGNFTFENTANSQKSVDLMLYKLDALGSQIIDSQVVATITTDGGFNYVLPINDSASYVIGWKTSKSAKFKLTSYGVTSSFGFPPFNTTTNLQVGNFSNPEIIKPSYDGWTIDTKTQNLVYSDRSTHCLAPSRGIHKNFITQANTQYKFSGDVKYLPNEVVVFPPFGLTGDAEEDTIVPQSFNTPDSLKITDISSSPVRITGVQFNKTTSIEKYFQATSGLTQIEFLLSSILESGYAYYVDNLKLEQILGGSTLYTSSFTNQDVVFSDLDGWETDWNSSYLSATTDTPNKLRVAGEAPQTERLFNVTPGLEYELIYTQTDNNAVDLLIEESANGTSWQSVYSASSSNGTQSVTFTPSNSLIKVSFESTNAFKLHDISLEGELYDTLITVESFGGTPWRYNWNTQERVPEIQKDHYTAPYWEYDPRVVHRWNRDPLAFKYPWNSPYVINNNNPIWFHDPLGDEWDTPEDKEKADDLNEKLETKKEYYKGIVDRFSDKNSKLFDKAQTALDKGKINKASKLVDRISNNLKKIREASLGVKEMERAQFELSEIDKSEVKFTFKATNNMLNETYMNESGTVVMEYSGDANAIHELAHGYQHLTGAIELVAGTRGGNYVDVSDEINAYRRQYFFSPVSVRNIRTTSKITIFSSYNITLRWLYNIYIMRPDQQNIFMKNYHLIFKGSNCMKTNIIHFNFILIIVILSIYSCSQHKRVIWEDKLAEEKKYVEKCRDAWVYNDLLKEDTFKVYLFLEGSYVSIVKSSSIFICTNHVGDTIAVLDMDYKGNIKPETKVVFEPFRWSNEQKKYIRPGYYVFFKHHENEVFCAVKNVYYGKVKEILKP